MDRLAVMEYTLSGQYPELARHLRDAQASGLPGAYPNGAGLQRLIDRQRQDWNRDYACPSSLPPIAGKSCDEYPFASTYQGAWFELAACARTFSGCDITLPHSPSTGLQGYSRCMINENHNELGGSALGAFYSFSRLIDGDPFQVGITA